MLRVSLLISMILFATKAFAGDTITDYVKSKIMNNNTITIAAVGTGNSLLYDNGNHSYSTMQNASFLADGGKGVVVVVKDFNPLKHYVKTDITEKEEQIFSTTKFTSALTSTGMSLSGIKAPGGGEACSFQNYSSKQRTEVKAITTDYNNLISNLKFNTLDTSMLDSLQSDRKTWKAAIQKNGALAKQIDDTQSNIDSNSKAIDKLISDIEKAMNNSDYKFDKCTSNYTYQLLEIWSVANLLKDKYIIKLKGQLQFLQSIKSNLDVFKEDRNLIDAKNNVIYEWVGDDLNLSFDPPTRKGYKVISLTYGDVEVSYTDQSIVQKNGKSGTFEYHKREYIIPEVGAGYIYSGIRDKAWGTKVVGGQTVVVKSRDEAMVGHAALMLNGIILTTPDSWAYPLIQLGIATDKDTPAFLTGVGIRFIDVPLVFSVGAIYSFNKELEGLKEGDAVTGTADIQNNLKYHPTASWYVGLQYNF